MFLRRAPRFSLFTVCVAAVLPTLLVVPVSALTGSGDPRCPSDFDPLTSCPSSMILPGGAGFNIARNVDVTGCTDQENCPRCLGSEAWQTKLINEVGLYSANRDPSFQPWVGVDEWLSAGIVSAITMLLLRDTMNISARAASMAMAGNTAFICCMDPLITMEQWTSSGTFLDDSTQHTTTGAANGYTGQSGLFVFPHTLEKYPLAFTYQAYRLLPDYQHIFPPSFSTACSNMTANATKGCVTGNYVCETNEWTNTSCFDSRWYVPPQCNVPGEVGDPTKSQCQEVIMSDPTYDKGYFEGMIKNNGLNMTLAYVGADRIGSIIRDAAARKADVIFYGYIPDPVITEVGAVMVDFAPVTQTCTNARNKDPTLNTAACGFPELTLMKRARTSALEADSDLKAFFTSFRLSNNDVSNLMAQHKSAGGNLTTYDLSCNWIKNNYDTWKSFVQNTHNVGQVVVVGSGLLDNPAILAAVIGLPVLFLLAVSGLFMWTFCRKRMSLKNAPRTSPLALVFTDIENSTMLWEVCGDDMGAAVEMHHAIIRSHIDEYGAYEVKTIGDSFMIACNSLGDATLMCLAIQTSLGECRAFPTRLQFVPITQSLNHSTTSVRLFDPNLAESLSSSPAHGGLTPKATTPTSSIYQRQKSSSPSMPSIPAATFNYPLRVRIGLHWCREVRPQLDRIHGRFDYYGHDVNVCARVEAQAQGGQIMVTAETMEAVMATDEYPLMIAIDSVSAMVKTNVELKGVSEKVTLFAMAPLSQVASGYVTSKLLRESSSSRHTRSLSSKSKSFGSELGESDLQSGSEITRSSRSANKASANYAAALLRVAYKAVPDAAKGLWVTSLSKILHVKFEDEDAKGGGEAVQQARRFEAVRNAVKENCLQSMSATQSMDDAESVTPSLVSLTA